MTGCRAWWIILLIVVARDAASAAADVVVPPRDGDDKRSSSSSSSSGRTKEHAYSWTGPNALVRSALVERQERLQYNCEREYGGEYVASVIGAASPESFRNVLVDDLHELLYCYVPKVRNLLGRPYSG